MGTHKQRVTAMTTFTSAARRLSFATAILAFAAVSAQAADDTPNHPSVSYGTPLAVAEAVATNAISACSPAPAAKVGIEAREPQPADSTTANSCDDLLTSSTR
jgi:hypothetical protein